MTTRVALSREVPDVARGWPGIAGVSFLATILSWRPYPWRTVYAGIDPSWEAGLTLGFMRHLQWGPSLVFTFGPYGFVDAILPFYRLTASLSVLYALAVVWGLAALIVSALRPTWGLLGAGVVAWAALTIAASRTGYADVAAATALALALAALSAGGERARLVLLGLLGALAGLQLMVKTNDGLLSLGLVIVVVALGTVDWWRAALVAGLPLLGTAFIAWVAAGQSIGNLPSYVRGSLSVATGYSSAMQLSSGRRAEDWYAVAVAVLLGLLFALAARGQPRRYQVAVLLLVAGWVWATVKEGFVRHDSHDLTFFGLVLVAMCLARLKRSYIPLQAGVLALTAVVFCLAAGTVPEQLHSPGATTSAFFEDIGQVFGLGGLGRAQSTARAQLLSSGDALPPVTLRLLEGHSVAVEPVQDSVLYAYPQLDWDPEPVLQGYTAYTSYLDRLNASFLASPRAPERILYEPWEVIDHRDGFLDPPATLEAMYCHYSQLPAPGPAQVLERAPDRCGRPAEVKSVSTHFGSRVLVPSEPGKMVTATFSVGEPVGDQLEGVLLKPPSMSLTLWGHQTKRATFRFIPGTAGDDHVLCLPASLGYSPAFTPPNIKALELSGGGWAAGQGRVTVTFYAVPLRPR